MDRRVIALFLGLSIFGSAPQIAAAIDVNRLNRILRALDDGDIRVRMQALIMLTRLRDRRSVNRVGRVLATDRVASVRALAAACLGASKDRSAIPILQARLRDRSASVRRQIRLAIARLAPTKPTRRAVAVARRRARSIAKARVLVRLGSMASKIRSKRRLRHVMRGIWQERLATMPRWIALAGPGQKANSRQKIYKVNSSITSFRRVRSGKRVSTSCTVSVMLDHKGSIVMMATGGATVEVAASRFGRRDASRVDRDALSTAIYSAHRNLMNYLARQ
jgi:hypothetical protein